MAKFLLSSSEGVSMGFISCGQSGYRAALYHGAGTYDDFDAWLAVKFSV